MAELNRESSSSPPGNQLKKRRIPGACDICKRKKVRCDSGAMPDNRCSNCIQFGFECTHRELTRTLGPAKGYVESLEARLDRMDRLLSKLHPGMDVNQEVDRIDKDDPLEPPAPGIPPVNDHETTVTPDLLTEHLHGLRLNPKEHRFFGKSSGYHLIQTAFDIKQEYTGATGTYAKNLKRTEFWKIPEWATKNPELEEEHRVYTYPDADLMPSLIDAYFRHFNIYLPLLHRPTFEKSVSEGLHISDSMFGATLLLVCAHGSRYSDDPRVLSNGSHDLRSAGWKWFEQVIVYRTSFYKGTTLYELQMHALCIVFAQSSEIPQGVWTRVGLALRLAQEVGAHRRRKETDTPPSAEDELWKRAFWVLLSLDRVISSHSGGACCLNDEDFDLDLPLECDDEYWGNGFQQPPETPSSIAFFTCFLGLTDILAYAMRVIYPTRRPNDKILNCQPRSEQQTIAQLDSAMNNWMDTLPYHLKWNPNREDTLFSKQSVALHATYYQVQIFIHRPFIPSPRNPCPATFPSLAICTNAARSCCHVIESCSRWGALPLVSLQMPAFTAAVILLLNIWSGKRSGYAPNPSREIQGIQRCMEVLKASEKRWASAGRAGDILRELASAGEVSMLDSSDQNLDTPRKKRPRDIDPSDISPPPQVSSDTPRSIVGTRRVSKGYSPQPPNFSLPMYGNELGRLPVYGQFKFSDSVPPAMPEEVQPFVNLNSVPMPDIHGAYATHASPFEDQMMEEDLVQHNQGAENYDQMSITTSDFSAPSTGSNFDFDSLSCFTGTMPAMDDATMAMWSAAPINLEMEDWNSYIHSFEQMTQAQGDVPT